MSRTLKFRKINYALMLSAVFMFLGCSRIPGRPGPGPEVVRPEEVLAFPALYQQNCAACHGENGRNGAAISLANPVYIALAGDSNLHEVIAKGVSGKLMPAFSKSAGGTLTDQQITVLAQGIQKEWGNPSLLAGQNPLPYLATLQGNAEHGLAAYGVFCARCHGAIGEGGPADGNANSTKSKLGSIVDPSYLAIISDQNLRSITIAGRPDEAMPDWRTDAARPMTDQEVTDILAWLASKRVTDPGQPYPAHP
ncbi:MAG: c-type cytochrome [Terracidiphilus sp.]|jgi:cytochrome c oxidase cbb3-type subunit 3/ubiquinol-cytochrome c reductase cytochrome c subunit